MMGRRQHITLIINGSDSAVKAEELAINVAANYGLEIEVVYILDEGWRNLIGDEWINTSETRMKFFRYFEDELYEKAENILESFRGKAKIKGIQARGMVLVGKPARIIEEASQGAALLVLPNLVGGVSLADGGIKISIDKLRRKVNCPIVIGARHG